VKPPDVSAPLPLAAASMRLRGKPGRPRNASRTTSAFYLETAEGSAAAANMPRLLDVQAAADYLSVSVWTIRDLEAAGELQRVRLPLSGHREVRRLLFDRLDLDRLVERSK
jgi:hypothetical protein